MKKILFIFSFMLCGILYAAVGCDLNDPDRDVQRLFPGSSTYKTKYLSIDRMGGEKLLKSIEQKLGDNFKGLYETIDVPYTFYEIYKDNKIVGYIHGVNQKGHYGGIQVFLALNQNREIISFYVQKLTSKNAKEFRSDNFGKQFVGLSLNDFQNYNVTTHEAKDAIKNIKNPAINASDDFYSILRAVKKNLILTQEFIFHNNLK